MLVGRHDRVEGAPQRRPGVLAGRPLAHPRGDLRPHLLLGDEDRVLLRFEVAEEARPGDPGGFGDFGRGHVVEAALGEDVEGRLGDLGPEVLARPAAQVRAVSRVTDIGSS